MGLNKFSNQFGTPRKAGLIKAVGRDYFPAGVKSDAPNVCYPSSPALMSKRIRKTG